MLIKKPWRDLISNFKLNAQNGFIANYCLYVLKVQTKPCIIHFKPFQLLWLNCFRWHLHNITNNSVACELNFQFIQFKNYRSIQFKFKKYLLRHPGYLDGQNRSLIYKTHIWLNKTVLWTFVVQYLTVVIIVWQVTLQQPQITKLFHVCRKSMWQCSYFKWKTNTDSQMACGSAELIYDCSTGDNKQPLSNDNIRLCQNLSPLNSTWAHAVLYGRLLNDCRRFVLKFSCEGSCDIFLANLLTLVRYFPDIL